MKGAVTQVAIERARPYAADLVVTWQGDGLRAGDPIAIRTGRADDLAIVRAFAKAIADETERCARIAESHSDDRGGRDRNFDWHDGYQDGCKGAAQSIRSTPGDVL